MIRAQRCIRQKSMPTRSSGDFGEPLVPEQQLPVEGPPLGPERRVERLRDTSCSASMYPWRWWPGISS